MGCTLLRRFPRLAGRLRWTPLAATPTPVQRAAGLDAVAAAGRGAEVWIKRDDQSGVLYGGNKVRKLEFLLAEAEAAGARRIVTAGALGSNHALATALYARARGIDTTVLLVPQPMTPGVREIVRRNLRALAATGAELVYCDSWGAAWARAAPLLAARANLWPPRAPFLVWPGGSSPTGALGYVEAALEVAEQVEAGLLPAPDHHVVAAGTGGTAAGLVAGLRLAGLSGEVAGVRVVEPPFADARVVRWLAGAALRRLARAAGERLAALPPQPGFVVLDGWLGGGYGAETHAAAEAIDTGRARAGVTADPIYTGKALAALLGEPRFAGRRVLLWLTKSSADLAPVLAGCPDATALPPELHRFFRDEGARDSAGGRS